MVEPTPVDETTQALGELRAQALTCIRCRLAEGRRQVVFGEGHPHARIMLIGQGPSESDDRSGHPYSGPSGPVLDKALAAAGLRREDIWLTNITKCLALAGGGGPAGYASLKPTRCVPAVSGWTRRSRSFSRR